MRTMSPASRRAISMDSVRRRSMPGLTTSRSTTISIEWLRRRSRAISSSRARSCPSTRAFRKPSLAPGRQVLLELALAAPHDGRQHVDPGVLRVRQDLRHDLVRRLRRDGEAALRAVGHADVREQQPQVVVDLGDGADRRARVRAGRLLLDRRAPATGPRWSRRRASPSARGTGGRRPRATRRSGAGPRRRSCRRRGTTCRIPTAP